VITQPSKSFGGADQRAGTNQQRGNDAIGTAHTGFDSTHVFAAGDRRKNVVRSQRRVHTKQRKNVVKMIQEGWAGGKISRGGAAADNSSQRTDKHEYLRRLAPEPARKLFLFDQGFVATLLAQIASQHANRLDVG
jgi:hypothetical protein